MEGKIRELTRELNGENPNYKILKAEFEIRLNPKDKEDNKIIEGLEDLIKLSRKLDKTQLDEKKEELNKFFKIPIREEVK